MMEKKSCFKKEIGFLFFVEFLSKSGKIEREIK